MLGFPNLWLQLTSTVKTWGKLTTAMIGATKGKKDIIRRMILKWSE